MPGKIIHDLSKISKDLLELEYDEEYAEFNEQFITSKKAHQELINNIMVVTDKRPQSVISIAYGIRFAQITRTDLHYISEGFHDKLINIKADRLYIPTKKAEFDIENTEDIQKYILENDIDMLIYMECHALADKFQKELDTPQLILDAKHFVERA